MLSRHLNELMARLERVEDIGFAEIRKNELLRWYGRDRLTKGVWADVYEKWQEVAEEPILLVGDSDGVWVLAFGSGMTTSNDSWLKEVRDLAGITQTG